MRIYADFSGLQPSPRDPYAKAVPLNTYGSLCDLSQLGIVLAEGMGLTLYDRYDATRDVEAESTAFYDAAQRAWFAELDGGGPHYVPASRARRSPLFCLDCRLELEAMVVTQGLATDTTCPMCGASALKPLQPPQSMRAATAAAVPGVNSRIKRP